MRIALIASNRFPISQPFAGGLEAHVWHLARALADAGHQVSLFAAAGSDPASDWRPFRCAISNSPGGIGRPVDARRPHSWPTITPT